MALKLKFKVGPSKAADDDSKPKDSETPRPLPKIKIKLPTMKDEPTDGISKPKHKKEKLKKLKISLGRAALPLVPVSALPAAPPEPPKRVPKVRVKPTRIPGEGYDSEAPDVEDDPLIEQGIVVRFANDANLDFVHNAVDTGDLSNVNIKWITREKAVINVNLTLYSARLVDLPTLTELYKTLDKKNIFKTIDISQMLLVLHPINPKQLNMETDFEVPEEYTYTHPLYKLSSNKEIRSSRTVYKDGLAYAFEDVYRRLRPKKVNHRVMADIDVRVDELIRRDAEAQESHYEFVDPKAQPRYGQNQSNAPSMPAALAVPEDRMQAQEEEIEVDFEADSDEDNVLEQQLTEALGLTSNNTAATVLMKSQFEDAEEANPADAEMDDDDDDDEDEEEEDDDDDEDEATKQDKARVKKLEEEIADLERAAEKQKVLLSTASYKMMRLKFQSAYNNLKGQLDLKKRELAKIREQHQKLLMKTEPSRNVAEEDDDGDDGDDAEDGEDDNENEEIEEENDDNVNVDIPQEGDHENGLIDPEGDQNIGVAADEDGDNEDFDDFQGLF